MASRKQKAAVKAAKAAATSGAVHRATRGALRTGLPQKGTKAAAQHAARNAARTAQLRAAERVSFIDPPAPRRSAQTLKLLGLGLGLAAIVALIARRRASSGAPDAWPVATPSPTVTATAPEPAASTPASAPPVPTAEEPVPTPEPVADTEPMPVPETATAEEAPKGGYDDGMLAVAVRKALLDDSDSRTLTIEVSAGVVTLTGTAADQDAADQLVRDAEAVTGVKAVLPELTVDGRRP